MKLTKEHIGRKVKCSKYSAVHVLIGFDGDSLVLKEPDGNYGRYHQDIIEDPNPWELVGPKKKPSQRIKDIAFELSGRNWLDSEISYILLGVFKFLDEQEEKK